MRLLCVEDEEALREDMVEYLRMQSYEVDEAKNGAEAVEKMGRNHYDLVLCDIKMPRMDGYELLRQVRGENQLITTPFIFLSALNEKNDKIRAQNGGCDAFLTKPIDFSVLDATVKSHIQRQRARNFVFDSTLESVRSHMTYALDDALSGPMGKALAMIDQVRQAALALKDLSLDGHLVRLEAAVRQHMADMHLLQDALMLQAQPVDLVRQSISMAALLSQVLGKNGAVAPGVLVDKNAANQHFSDHVYVDQPMVLRALSSLRHAIPAAQWQEDCLRVVADEHRCVISISDHPNMVDDDDFVSINGATNLAVLSHVTRQRLIPLMFAMQTAQAHGGHLEIKLWADDRLAVRLIIPHMVANSLAA